MMRQIRTIFALIAAFVGGLFGLCIIDGENEFLLYVGFIFAILTAVICIINDESNS